MTILILLFIIIIKQFTTKHLFNLKKMLLKIMLKRLEILLTIGAIYPCLNKYSIYKTIKSLNNLEYNINNLNLIIAIIIPLLKP